MTAAGSTGTAVATLDRKGITALLQSDNARTRIEPMLRGVEYNRVIGEVYLAVGDSPEILQCTPASIVSAVARACSWGLVIGETVHLVAFNVNIGTKDQPKYEKRLKPIQDYKGVVELVVGAGGAKSIDAQVVYEKESFIYRQGTLPSIEHSPAKSEKERGGMIGAYAIAYHGYTRPPHIVYLTLAEIDAIRKRHSKQWKEGPCPPWYARKTCVKQVAKLLPKNARLAAVLTTLEEEDVDEELPAGGPVATVDAPVPGRAQVQDPDFDFDDQQDNRRDREPGEE